MFFCINLLFNGGGDINILIPQVEGYIICFQHSFIAPNTITTVVSGNSFKDILLYILQNPLRFLELALLRLFAFFNLTRPYYSFLHNLYLAAIMLAFYFSAISSMFRFSLFKTNNSKNFFLMLFLAFVASVMLQCDDFNSRFIMPFFPIIILLAVNFWNNILKKKKLN